MLYPNDCLRAAVGTVIDVQAQGPHAPRKFFEGYHIVPRDDAAAARGPVAV